MALFPFYLHSQHAVSQTDLWCYTSPSHIFVVREAATWYIMCICFEVWERLNCLTAKSRVNAHKLQVSTCHAVYASFIQFMLIIVNFWVFNVIFSLKITNLGPSRHILWWFLFAHCPQIARDKFRGGACAVTTLNAGVQAVLHEIGRHCRRGTALLGARQGIWEQIAYHRTMPSKL